MVGHARRPAGDRRPRRVGTIVTERSIRELPLNVRDPMGLVDADAGRRDGGQLRQRRRHRRRPQLLQGGLSGRRRPEPTARTCCWTACSNITGDRRSSPTSRRSTPRRSSRSRPTASPPNTAARPAASVTVVTRSGHATSCAGSGLRVPSQQTRSTRTVSSRSAPGSGAGRLPAGTSSGGVGGGPIRHDRTFFFGAYEGLRQEFPQTLISTVPTRGAAARRFLADLRQRRAG